MICDVLASLLASFLISIPEISTHFLNSTTRLLKVVDVTRI